MKKVFNILFLFFSCFFIVEARDLLPPEPSVRPPGFTPTLIASRLEDLPENSNIGEIFFVDETLDQVLKILAEFTGKKILSAENLPNPVFNFDSQGTISREEAIVVIESLLSMNGIAVAEMGDRFLRIIPSGSLKNKSPDMIESPVVRLFPSEKMYSKLFRVKYMKWEDVTQLVNSRLSPGGAGVELYEANKSFILTDSLVNLQRIERLLLKLDIPSEKEIIVYNLNYILAVDLKAKLETSVSESLNGFIEGSISIQADDRTNLIIIATDKVNVKFLEKLIKTYDVDTTPITSTEVVYIKHAESASIVSLIESIINSEKQNVTGIPTTGSVAPIASVDAFQQGTLVAENDGKLQFSEYLSLVADERSNSVVIYGTHKDITFVSALIADLDVLLAQVKIDVIIAEVTLTDEDSRGIESFGISYDENDEIRFNLNDGSDLGWNLEGTLEDIFLRSWTLSGFNMASVFDTAKRNSNVTVLSAPTLVTTHNREAIITAGESRPVITSSNTDSTGLSTRSQVQFKDIGIQLKVKPLIGSNGIVQMEIEQTVESVVDEVLIDGNSQPVIGKREATSFVSVRSGEMIILGGLQETTVRNVKGKMAFLGKIPFLGSHLFSSNRDRSIRRELVIFIRPTVYFGHDDIKSDLDSHLSDQSDSMKTMLKSYGIDSPGNETEIEDTDENSDELESLIPKESDLRRMKRF